mgnify:FL=1
MKKTLILSTIFFFFISFSFSQEAAVQPQINWLSWFEAIEQHQKDMIAYNDTTIPVNQRVPPKKMYIDFYTSWCGWCKKMDKTTFQDPAIISIMNKYYYPVKFNAEMSQPIDFNGHTFVNPNPGKTRSTHQFAASILEYQLSYPSYVVLDENLQRSVIYKGYLQVDDLLGIILFFGKNRNQTYLQQITKQVKQQEAVKK